MITAIILFTLFYFLVGFAGTVLTNRKSTVNIRRQRWIKYYVYLLIVFVILSIIQLGSTYFFITACLILLTGFYELFQVYRSHKILAANFFLSSLFIFVIFSFGFLQFSRMGNTRVLLIYFLVVVFDGFSQLTGQLIGKRKFTPISPNKTIEGILGGFLCCLLSAIILTRWSSLSIREALLSAFVISMASLAGDLLASWYKRKMVIKDYSNLIPGHGGVLDRFDSFIAAGAVWYLVSLFSF